MKKFLMNITAVCILASSQLLAVGLPNAAKIEMDGQGNKVAVWELIEGGVTIIEAATCASNSSTWSTPQQISGRAFSLVNLNSVAPKLAINSTGQAVAIWMSTNPDTGINSLCASTIALQGLATWSSATAVSNPTLSIRWLGQDPCYSVKLSENGKAVAFWQSIDFTLASSTTTVLEVVNIWSAPSTISGPSAMEKRSAEEIQTSQDVASFYKQVCDVICPSN